MAAVYCSCTSSHWTCFSRQIY